MRNDVSERPTCTVLDPIARRCVIVAPRRCGLRARMRELAAIRRGSAFAAAF
jgi:hypothetical protein